MSNDQLFRQALQRQNDRAAGMKMPDDMEQRVMERIKPKPTARRRWLYPALVGTVAASIALLLMLHHFHLEPKEQPIVAQPYPYGEVAQTKATASEGKLPTDTLPATQGTVAHQAPERTVAHPARKREVAPPRAVAQSKRRAAQQHRELPDTLGDGIWQSQENVMLAMQMLSECEVTIERGEQRIRNDIVRTTYQATPQSAHLQLVVCDNGDCMVVDDRQPVIIEL